MTTLGSVEFAACAAAAPRAPASSDDLARVRLAADSAECSGRRQLLSSSAIMAVVVASGGWAHPAAAEDGANPITGTDAPLTLAEPSGTKGVSDSDRSRPTAVPVGCHAS